MKKIYLLSSYLALLLSLGYGLPSECYADQEVDQSLESDTSIGSTDFIEQVSYDGNQTKDGKNVGWNWNLAYTYSKQTTPATASASEITDVSSQFVGGFGYKKDWESGFGLTYSVTPAEDLHDVGPNAYLGYTFKFGQKGDEGSFQPSLRVKGSLADLSYTEDFTHEKKPPRNPLAKRPLASESINQFDWALETDYNALEWLTPKLTFTKYHYSKNVNEFLNALDRPQAIRLGASNFASTLSGFPEWVFEPVVVFYFLETWEFEYDYTLTQAQADHSKTVGNKALLSDDLNSHFKLALGFEHDSSQDNGVENLVLAQVTYSF